MTWAFDWLPNNKDTEHEEEIWSISDLELDLDLIKFSPILAVTHIPAIMTIVIIYVSIWTGK